MRFSDNNTAKSELIIGVILFGILGILINGIDLPSSVIALIRGIIGALFLLVLVLIKGERLSPSDIKRNLPVLAISGIFLGANWILLFEAYRHTTIATATLCYYMAPIFVVTVSSLIYKERVTYPKILCIALMIVGMVLVSGVLQRESTFKIAGIACGLGAAVCYASVTILNRTLKQISSYDTTIMQLGIAAAVIFPYTLVTENIPNLVFSPTTVILLFIVAIFNTGVAFALYFDSIRRLKAQTVAIFSYLDPVVAILLAALILHQRLDALESIGAVLLLGAAVAGELLDAKKA